MDKTKRKLKKQLPLNIILDNIGDLAIQNVAKPGKNIGIDALDCAGAPFFHYLKTSICQLGKAVAGNAPFFNQFFQMNGNVAVGTEVYYTAQFFHIHHQDYCTQGITC